jgi:hypothetical protein
MNSKCIYAGSPAGPCGAIRGLTGFFPSETRGRASATKACISTVGPGAPRSREAIQCSAASSTGERSKRPSGRLAECDAGDPQRQDTHRCEAHDRSRGENHLQLWRGVSGVLPGERRLPLRGVPHQGDGAPVQPEIGAEYLPAQALGRLGTIKESDS